MPTDKATTTKMTKLAAELLLCLEGTGMGYFQIVPKDGQGQTIGAVIAVIGPMADEIIAAVDAVDAAWQAEDVFGARHEGALTKEEVFGNLPLTPTLDG